MRYTVIYFNVFVLFFLSFLRRTSKKVLHLYIILMCRDQYFWRICRCFIFWKRNSYWQYCYVKISISLTRGENICIEGEYNYSAHLTDLFFTR